MSFYCIKCKKDISDEEYTYSMRFFKKALCRKDQPTEEARKLGSALEKFGWFVKYEAYDGYKHVDLEIPEAKIDIEIDGLHHVLSKDQALKDVQRAYYSYKKQSIMTLHIPNILVQGGAIDETAKYINDFIKESKKDVEQLPNNNWFQRFIRGLLDG